MERYDGKKGQYKGYGSIKDYEGYDVYKSTMRRYEWYKGYAKGCKW